MGKTLRDALDRADVLSRWAIVACMAVMIAVVSAQVFLRYGFSASLDWAEEVSRLAFVWAVFLGVPHGVKAAAHVGIDVVVKHFPPGASRALQRLVKLASVALMSVVAYQAALAALDSWDQLMPTVDLSSGWFYLAVSVGAVHSALRLIEQVLTGDDVALPAMAEAAQ